MQSRCFTAYDEELRNALRRNLGSFGRRHGVRLKADKNSADLASFVVGLEREGTQIHPWSRFIDQLARKRQHADLLDDAVGAEQGTFAFLNRLLAPVFFTRAGLVDLENLQDGIHS